MERLSEPSVADGFERQFVRPRQGRTLIVGSRVYPGRVDRRGLYENAEGWDALPGDGVDRVINLENEIPSVEQFAHIECVSVLEHTKRPWLLARNIEQLLRVGGTLYLTVPFIWRVHSYPDDFWRFTVSGVRALFSSMRWDSICYSHLELTESIKSPGATLHGHTYLPRTEVCAFGVRL